MGGLKGNPPCKVYVGVLYTGSKPGGNSAVGRVFEPVKVSSGVAMG